MNLSTPFIERPVATTLLTIGVALAGMFAFFQLPVSPLPQVDFPTISVHRADAGRQPRDDGDDRGDAAGTPSRPHRRRHRDDLVEHASARPASRCNSASTATSTAPRATCRRRSTRRAPTCRSSLRTNPTYRKVNPADAPILILALTSDTLTHGQIYDAASTVLPQKLSQIDGIGQVTIGGSSLPAVRVELNPLALFKYGIGLEDVRAALSSANAHSPKGAIEQGELHFQIYTNDQAAKAADYRRWSSPTATARRCGCRMSPTVDDSVENLRNLGLANGKPAVLVILYRQPSANIIDTVDRVNALAAAAAGVDPAAASTVQHGDGPHDDDPRLAARCRDDAGDRDLPGDPGRVRVPAQRARDADPQRRGAGVADRHVRRDVSAGLQPRQSVADGADDRDRVCRRRRDRRAGERHAPYRGRHGRARRRRCRARARSASPCCR